MNHCLDLDQSSYSSLSDNARKFAAEVSSDEKYETATLQVLNRALEVSFGNRP